MAASSTGRVVIITGANSGLGLETARKIAADATNTVILGCRNAAKGEQARAEIVASTGNQNVRAMVLDVASLESVRAFVAAYESEVGQPIDALVCNAGISRGPARTADGFDGVFETNHLGHFLLTELLLPRMAANGRVISVSSDMHSPPGPALRWRGVDAIAYPNSSPAIVAQRYSYSKLSNLYFVHELARRLEKQHSSVVTAAFNPGLMTETNFTGMSGPIAAAMRKMFADRLGNLETSSTALAELAVGDLTEPFTGQYFDRTAEHSAESSKLSHDEANARELWEFSERVVS